VKKPKKTAEVEEITRVTFPVPKSLLSKVEKFWHAQQLKSLSAALRALLERGLKA
jgi:hypothetical protein